MGEVWHFQALSCHAWGCTRLTDRGRYHHQRLHLLTNGDTVRTNPAAQRVIPENPTTSAALLQFTEDEMGMKTLRFQSFLACFFFWW